LGTAQNYNFFRGFVPLALEKIIITRIFSTGGAWFSASCRALIMCPGIRKRTPKQARFLCRNFIFVFCDLVPSRAAAVVILGAKLQP